MEKKIGSIQKKYDFYWLVHPMDEKQRKEWAIRQGVKVEQLIKECPKVIDEIRDELSGTIGCVLSTPLLPIDLIKRKTVIEQLKMIKLMIDPKVPVGLGAWWATVTRSGKLAKEILDNPIIDGYTGTVNRIVEQVYENINGELNRVAIIGGGNVGKRIYNTLKKYNNIIFDKFKINELNDNGYNAFHVDELKSMLHEFDIGICCTTATVDIIKREDIPEGFVFIDDSYPHSIPDYEGRVDGGMYTDPQVSSKWLIQNGQVYGCLMELIEKVRETT